MAAFDRDSALSMVKARLNRLPGDTSLDGYLSARIDAAAAALENTGILIADTPEDLMLVVDMSVWDYQNRDKPGAMPEWLRLRRRERWLHQREAGA